MNHISFIRMVHQYGIEAAVQAAYEMGISQTTINRWLREVK